MDSSTINISENVVTIQKSLFFSTQVILEHVFSSYISTWFVNTNHELWIQWHLPEISGKIPPNWSSLQDSLLDSIITLLSAPNISLENLCKEISVWVNKLLMSRSTQEIHPLGQIFTPFSVVDQIIDQIEELQSLSPNISLVDFAAGSGHFIIRVLIRHLNKLWQQTQHNRSEFLDVCGKLRDTLIACEIDAISLYALFIFSTLITLEFCLQQGISIDADLLSKLPFLTLLRINFLDLQRETLGFSPQIIIGNPPYIFSRDLPPTIKEGIKNKGYRMSKGQFDLADVFLEHSLALLAPSGILGVIIAEPILTLHTRSELRQLLIEHCQFLHITSVSRTFMTASVANVILVGQSNPLSLNDCNLGDFIRIQSNAEPPLVHLKKNLLIHKDTPLIPSKSLQNQAIAWIHSQYMSIDEWNQLNSDSLIYYFRGVEIGKNGEIMQCQHCQKWMPYSNTRRICAHCNESLVSPRRATLIRRVSSTDHLTDLILKPSERWFLQQFSSKSPINGSDYTTIPDAVITLDKSGIIYKPFKDYDAPRIIVRQLLDGYRLCVGRLSPSVFTSQSIYNIVLPPPLQSFQSQIVQHLQSDLILYYLYHTFSRGKRLFSRILLSKLRTLPLIPRNFPTQANVLPPDQLSLEISQFILSLKSLL